MLKNRRIRVVVGGVVVLVAAAVICWRVLLSGLPSLDHPLGASRPSVLIADRSGRLLYEVIDPNGSKQVPLALADIPLACQQATIATEDGHFYSHSGIDPVAVVRAMWQNWREGHTVSGGSTLTQQLARNLYMTADERTERSVRRKLRELWLAWRLERAYSKDELLALYLNTTYYGHFSVGIEAAAQAYFGMHARELDLAQCALIAGLPQYPTGYNPIENPEAARYRQGVVLGLMMKDGYITKAQSEDAHKEELAYASTPFPIEAPHFVMWVQGQLESMLGSDRLRAGGLKVTTTLDLDWQQQAESIVARRLTQLRPCASGADPASCDATASPSRRVDDAALVALDPRDGAVLAMVGSASYFDRSINGAVNAALSLRQPGSAIKPLTYAAAFDPARAAAAGRTPWTPATLVADVRTVFPTREGQPYVPQDYDLRFHGPVTVRTALANSYNIPAVKALQYVGVDALIDQAGRLGIDWGLGSGGAEVTRTLEIAGLPAGAAGEPSSALQPARFGLALTLGGGEVRLLDLTAAYAAFANGGHRVTPYAIERVETLDGQVLFDARRQEKSDQAVLDPRVAYLVTDILSDEDARLPAFGPGNVLEIGRPAAAKTGTTTDWRDNWTMGYTPDLATGVWVGNPDNTPMLDISGITGAGPIWHDFMITVLQDRPARAFARPDGLVQAEVCADSGLLPAGGENGRMGEWEDGRAGEPHPLPHSPTPPLSHSPTLSVPCPSRRQELFIAGTEPKQVDRMHEQVRIDVRTGQPATEATPLGYTGVQTYWVLPAEYQAWARQYGFPQPPAALAGAQSVGAESGGRQANSLALTSPDPNRSYKLDPGLPAQAQQIAVTAQPGPQLAARGTSITLLIDGKPLAALAAPNYTTWWQLAPGEHIFQALAAGPDGSLARSAAVTIVVEK